MRGRFFIGVGLIVGGALSVAACDETDAGQFLVAVGAALMSFELLWNKRENRP